ncbi:hypothetical protein MUK72_17945 (plasmid) [Halococcus dombrowskii]|uniref:Small CPxCG-related zinc finger protein n=1 Tax=Halococcus dombrowskii TaxID=179637 RepID=A0AAV3SF51_HALDO|nr:hypothetical protein [Halococcus dombrowskii]UOO97149.1 hypothetical protein MUK72_17945 [Halococcus dombrowskii]
MTDPEITPVDEARCPECGNEEIERVEHPRLPPDHRGHCTECDHRAHPLAFHHSWKWNRMTEDEREEARRQHERYVDQVAEHQYSSAYLAAQRET